MYTTRLAKFVTMIATLFLLSLAVSTISGARQSQCPLWHVEQKGKCKCITTLRGHITECNRDTLVLNNICLTWDNQTDSVQASYCLYNYSD